MRKIALIAGVALVSAGAIAMAVAGHRAEPKARPMHEIAQAFLATLSSEQKAKATFAFESEERFNWHFIPRERKGLPWADMGPTQEKAAIELLKASLSAKGYHKAETIRALENVLKEIEKGSGPVRDPQRYFFSLFGTPAAKGVWGWRYEGHHMSLQWTVIDGKVAGSTPQFMGTNPGEVRIEHAMKGTRVLGTEEDLGFKLVGSLDEKQLKTAIIDPKAPNDILTTNQREASIQADTGIAYSELKADQKKTLMSLIEEVATTQNESIAKDRLDKVKKAGLDSIKFAWMGATKRNEGHYYRIQGKTFLIEYDNTQNNANHVHLVWRDFKGDFGADLLAEHYKSADSHHGHDHVHTHDAESADAGHSHSHDGHTHDH
jgi:hypothetical protein